MIERLSLLNNSGWITLPVFNCTGVNSIIERVNNDLISPCKRTRGLHLKLFDLLRRSSFVVTINGGTVKVSHGTGEGSVHSNEKVVMKLVRLEPSPQQIGLLSCFGKLFHKRNLFFNTFDESSDLELNR